MPIRQSIERLERLVTAVASRQAQPTPSSPSAATHTGSPTDEDLWSMAQQGDRQAFDLYMERIADRRNQVTQQAVTRQQIVASQLQTLANTYPVLHDPAHPLSQAVTGTYQVLVQTGAPAGTETLLNAIKDTLSSRPDLVTEVYARRAQSPSRAVPSTIPPSVRQTPAAAPAPALSAAEAGLAQRMGIKDPAGAKQRFQQRQAAGQSKLGAVAAYLPESG